MIEKKKIIHPEKSRFAILKNTPKRRIRKSPIRYFSFILFLILILGASLILVYQKGFGQLEIKKGDTATEVIKAPKTVTFKSLSKTEELKEKATQGVPKVYRLDSKITTEQENKINIVVGEIDKIRSKDIPLEEKIKTLDSLSDLKLSDEQARLILGFDDGTWGKVTKQTRLVLLELQKKEKIKYEELGNFKNQLPLKINPNLPENEKKIIIVLGQGLLLPNTFLDEVETEKRINEAKEGVAPIYYTVEKDQIVLKPGDKVTDLDIEKLEALGLTSISFVWYKFLGTLIIVFILSLLSFIFIYYFITTKVPSYKVFLIYIIFLLTVIFLARIILPLKPMIAYLFPVAAPVMLLAILIDFRLALFSALIFSIFFSLAAGGSFELIIVHLTTALAGLLVVKNIRKPNVFIRIILFIALANFLISFAFNLLVGNFSLRTIIALLAAGFICGLINAVLVAGFMVFIGNILGVTSFLQLSDLASPEQPLLKELSLTAPGTYHHSILVSNLAEQGAKAIGADSLLARVGAYYHDIGKMERPLFFVENQEGALNVHEKMDPRKSVSYIINHVSEGLKIAEAYHLPSEIKNIIAEHHGTTCVQFFYQLAKKKKLKVNKKDFCYPGPCPSTKESAIIMLADSLEASMRSLSHFTPKAVYRKTEEIFKVRFEEGQLNRCPLTISDLSRLKDTFIETASAVFHQRVSYPRPYSHFKKITKMDWFSLKK
jgi:cyclic-di-AMP phosphodiesterase PgpH